jgi:hypothetical protein
MAPEKISQETKRMKTTAKMFYISAVNKKLQQKMKTTELKKY